MKKPAPRKPKPAKEPSGIPSGKKPPARTRPARPAAGKPAPAAPASAPVSITTVAARADIGFGNVLFIRGGGPGLSWDFGLPMTCQRDDLWTFDILDAAHPVAFKFLVNDESWSIGPDYIVEPGAQLEVTPHF
jgi:hypothetical protein